MPGSFELPVVAKGMAKSGKYDAIVCIGAVVGALLCSALPSPPHVPAYYNDRLVGVVGVSATRR